MGLDNFKSDDSSSSASSSSSTNSSSGKVEPTEPLNKPSNSTATFTDDRLIAPRQIYYQIKSQGGKWVRQFSHLRLSRGEIVMFSSGVNSTVDDKTVAVFTTIQSEFDSHPNGDELPIWVVVWSFPDCDNLTEGEYIEYESNWEKSIRDAITTQLEELHSIVE